MQTEKTIDSDVMADKRLIFRNFVTEHRRKIYHLAYDLTGSSADAEDLSQEVFLKAYRALDSFRVDASMYTWLYRITVTTFIDQKRKKSDQARRLTDELDETRLGHKPDDPGGSAHLAGPEQQCQRELVAERIRQALTVLSEKERSVFMLRHKNDLTIDEIASTMAIAPGTVKSFLFRATRKLRRQLGAAGAGEENHHDEM